MAYFKIEYKDDNGMTVIHDYSMYVNKLLVDTKHKYTARENASGNLLVKYITKKHNINVGIIPLDASVLSTLMSDINRFEVTVHYLDPETNSLRSAACIIPINSIEYYTIQAGNTMTKAFNLTFEEK